MEESLHLPLACISEFYLEVYMGQPRIQVFQMIVLRRRHQKPERKKKKYDSRKQHLTLARSNTIQHIQ
jgi:hypothetical protein